MYNYRGEGTRHGTAQSGVMMACLVLLTIEDVIGETASYVGRPASENRSLLLMIKELTKSKKEASWSDRGPARAAV
jgi:hypothetical protein